MDTTEIVSAADKKIFLEGPAGCGKTTLAVGRLRNLLAGRVPASSVLVLVPQQALGLPYVDAMRRADFGPYGPADVLTVDALAWRTITLFWPLVAREAGFGDPQKPPTMLTVETAQYYMNRVVEPLVEEEGYFDAALMSISIRRGRLVSQLLDNLNKSAIAGLDYGAVGERLRDALELPDSRGQGRAMGTLFEQAQECANRFRAFCLERNLLDFSLRMEVFGSHMLQSGEFCDYVCGRYRHLIADNVEEDTPLAHRFLARLLGECESALVVYDSEASYREFLGADDRSARRLRDLCDARHVAESSFVTTPDLLDLAYHVGRGLNRPTLHGSTGGNFRDALILPEIMPRFHTQMVDDAADTVSRLVVREKVPPSGIVMLAPFVSDALRFSLMEKLERLGVPAYSHRPSRALREEPVVRCMLTLTRLAHPHWRTCPNEEDVAQSLMLAIADMDSVRAHLLGSVLYRITDGVPRLHTFGQVKGDMRERISHLYGHRYELLRGWLEAYVESGERHPLDHFLSRLFGERLSQVGFGFHHDYEAGQIAANLVESVRKFRMASSGIEGEEELGRVYIGMVEEGIVAGHLARGWEDDAEAVLIAPAYTFLIRNRPVDYQFWLDAGSTGWWERIYQPLTHPYILSEEWTEGQKWSDAEEYEAQQRRLYRLVLGLVRRCRRKVYLGISHLGEQGYEQRGPLLAAIQGALRRTM